VSECCKKFQVRLGKRVDLAVRHVQDADGPAPPDQRDTEDGSDALSTDGLVDGGLVGE